MSTRELAEKLYKTYCIAVGGKAFNGDPLPNWKQFRADPTKKVQSEAWMKVAECAGIQASIKSNTPPYHQ